MGPKALFYSEKEVEWALLLGRGGFDFFVPFGAVVNKSKTTFGKIVGFWSKF
jgi:hypothetical protein